MGKFYKTPALAPAVLAVSFLLGGQAHAACINWSDAKKVIASNGLLKPGKVRSREIRRGGEVVSIRLCRNGGKYVYRLTVIGKKKRVRDIVVDARSGRSVGSKNSSKTRLKKRIINRVRKNLRRHGINF